MRKVLITGATGFTGRYLAPKLTEAGYEVHGTVQGRVEPTPTGVAELHRLDIGDAQAVENLVSALSADKVVHLAAVSFAAHLDVAEMYRANILGTRNLLQGLARCSVRPTAILVASSATVYGNATEGVLAEDAPIAPANDYGITKAATELVAAAYRSRLPLIVTRPFNYTGRGQSPNFLVPKIVDHVRRGASEIELGNLDVARDFSDVRAVVDCYARLLEAPQAIGGLFNICSGQATSLNELVELIGRIAAHRLNVTVNPAFARPDEVKVLRGSPDRLESVIGPLAMPPLEETLRWMLED